MLLDIAVESSDWSPSPSLKSALGGVKALIKHYELLRVEGLAASHS